MAADIKYKTEVGDEGRSQDEEGAHARFLLLIP
jgi:hypothetical protein